MSKTEIIDLIEGLRKRQFIDLRLSNVRPEVIIHVATIYDIQVFHPEDHPLNFYFLKAYIDPSGRITNTSDRAVSSFSINSNPYEMDRKRKAVSHG